MKKTYLLSMLATLLLAALPAARLMGQTAKLIVPTTIEDGKFAADTRWYTLQLDGSFQVVANGEDVNLSADDLSFALQNQWCFVGDSLTGMHIYNRAAGTEKVLVSPKAMTGTNGGTAYPVLRTLEGLDDGTYEALWMYETSKDLTDEGGVAVYLMQYGTLYAANQRDGRLAFWTKGRDHGSTFFVHTARQTYDVSQKTGKLTSTSSGSVYNYMWSSNLTNPVLTLTHSRNNIAAATDDDGLLLYDNNGGGYTLSAGEGYAITGYTLSFTADKAMTVTPAEGGGPQTCAAGDKAGVTASGLNDATARFTVSGGGSVHITSLMVSVARKLETDPTRRVVFKTTASGVPYRIPALAKTNDGTLIAVADYRYCKADIGNGPIDIHFRLSTDNGQTWGEEAKLADGNDQLTGNDWRYAFGDPCIVADRESPNVVAFCVGGHVGFFGATSDNPQHTVCFRSSDGGKTWDKGTNMTKQIYALYDNRPAGKAQSIFFTSGRIMQSRYVKVGDYYRLYVAHPVRPGGISVVYSDDFGYTWHVLGSASGLPSTVCDECKCEELPDGSVLLSIRGGGGRRFNVFTYTNSERAEGFWSTETNAQAMNGVNACNGEVIVLPAKRKADGVQTYVLLQSVPQSGARENVGFYFKELSSYADYGTGAAFATGWKKGLQVSKTTSCYSTLELLDDGRIAFLYEETSLNGGYDIIYKVFALDSITLGAYDVDLSFTDRTAYFDSGIAARVGEFVGGDAVGMPRSLESIDAAMAAYNADKTQTTMENVLAAFLGIDDCNPLIPTRRYYLRNNLYPTHYLTCDTSTKTLKPGVNARNVRSVFVFEATDEGDGYRLYNPVGRVWVSNTVADRTAVPVTSDVTAAAVFDVVSNVYGHSSVACRAPEVEGHNAIHDDGNGRIVGWTTDAAASQWYIEPYDKNDGLDAITTPSINTPAAANRIYDLQGRRVSEKQTGIVIENGRKVLK
ncbi:MAG: exo-alpha-sialidase [Alloprevotella sp.]|nr:exo-alpha-sialidase [Alloprevotella sp.]